MEVRTSVKYRVIYRHKAKYSISEMCRFFGVSRCGYYDCVHRMEIPDRNGLHRVLRRPYFPSFISSSVNRKISGAILLRSLAVMR